MIRDDPWLVAEAVSFIDRILMFNDQAKVLETGAGGSTLWFARRCKTIISYEHSKKWFNIVKKALKTRNIDNVDLIYAPKYPKTGLPDEEKKYYDFVLIDGRGRMKSIRTLYSSVKPGGYLILDNSERPRYKNAVKFLTKHGWPRIDFIDKWQTSFWRKPMEGE